MRSIRLASLLALAVTLTGCINSATLIKVKADGSGTVENTLLMNTQAMKMMLSGMGGDASKQGPVINEADLKRQAERMGGVRFVSAEPIKASNGFEGVKAVFAFDDINKVQVSQDPQLSGSSDGAFSAPATSSSPVKFALKKGGGSSVLTISFDDEMRTKGADADAADKPGASDMPSFDDPAMMGMIKAMFAGFKVAIDLEVDGKIVKTNADYVTGSRLTLLELDMGAILENEAQLKALQSKIKPGASLGEVRPYLKDIKGVKVNEPTVTVEFR